MSHFRDRVILTPGNIPQLPSGRVIYAIGSYRIFVPPAPLALDQAMPAIAASTGLGAVNAYAANPPSLVLDALIPTITASAHSP